jgi:hypothetical protein
MNNGQRLAADGSIRTFVVKTAIIALAAVVAIGILLTMVNNMVEQRIDQLRLTVAEITHEAAFRPQRFWPKLEADIEKAAAPSNDLSPERKAKLMAAIRILIDRWGPLLAEASAETSNAMNHPGAAAQK